jgi:hypothetical protein
MSIYEHCKLFHAYYPPVFDGNSHKATIHFKVSQSQIVTFAPRKQAVNVNFTPHYLKQINSPKRVFFKR